MAEGRAEIRPAAAVKLQMLQIPLKFLQIGHQCVLLHLAVTLQDVQPELLEKQPLTAQNVPHSAEKPRAKPARAGGRRIQHDHHLPQLPLLGVLERLDQRHPVVMLQTVHVPRIGKIRIVHMPVLPHLRKRAQQRGEARLIVGQLRKIEPLVRRAGADLRPVRLHQGMELALLPLPDGGQPLAGCTRPLLALRGGSPIFVTVAPERLTQLVLRDWEFPLQPCINAPRRIGRAVTAGIKRLRVQPFERPVQQPLTQKLRRHVARQIPARCVTPSARP